MFSQTSSYRRIVHNKQFGQVERIAYLEFFSCYLISPRHYTKREVFSHSGSCDVAFQNPNGKELPEQEVGFS